MSEKSYTISAKDAALIVGYLGKLREISENTVVEMQDEWEQIKMERFIEMQADELRRLQSLFLPLELEQQDFEDETKTEQTNFEWGRFPVKSPIEGETRNAWVIIRDDGPCVLYGETSPHVVPNRGNSWGGRWYDGEKFRREIDRAEAVRMAKEYAESLLQK